MSDEVPDVCPHCGGEGAVPIGGDDLWIMCWPCNGSGLASVAVTRTLLGQNSPLAVWEQHKKDILEQNRSE